MGRTRVRNKTKCELKIVKSYGDWCLVDLYGSILWHCNDCCSTNPNMSICISVSMHMNKHTVPQYVLKEKVFLNKLKSI